MYQGQGHVSEGDMTILHVVVLCCVCLFVYVHQVPGVLARVMRHYCAEGEWWFDGCNWCSCEDGYLQCSTEGCGE